MEIEIMERVGSDGERRIAFSGEMTCDEFRRMEDFVIEVMARYARVSLDLSAVTAIDFCGIYLLSVLHNVGGEAVRIAALAPAVAAALERLSPTPANASLQRSARRCSEAATARPRLACVGERRR